MDIEPADVYREVIANRLANREMTYWVIGSIVAGVSVLAPVFVWVVRAVSRVEKNNEATERRIADRVESLLVLIEKYLEREGVKPRSGIQTRPPTPPGPPPEP